MSAITVPRAVLEQALEALGFSCPAPDLMDKHKAAEDSLRTALEQPEKEPEPPTQAGALHAMKTALWKQEPVTLFAKYGPPTMRDRDFWSAGYAAATARAIEAALKEKNNG